mgnify:CR=1 FL=1
MSDGKVLIFFQHGVVLKLNLTMGVLDSLSEFFDRERDLVMNYFDDLIIVSRFRLRLP